MSEGILRITSLSKVFETDEGQVVAVDNVNLDIAGDEFFSLLGPSGCGKTTTLRMIAGLESLTTGRIEFNGKNIAGLSAAERNIGMVFQSYALFPHMSVFENAAYGLRVRKLPTAVIRPKVERLLELLGLKGLANRYPGDLSGGQQQRVSIARALAYDPNMFLLDEPLANLDAKLRIQMREEIRRIQKELGVMALYVTHDQEEAMSVSDRIGVFKLGKLMQVGAPPDVYQNPTSLFVADFIGKINLFPVNVLNGDTAACRARFGEGYEMTLHRMEVLTPEEKNEFAVTREAVVAVRPEHLTLSDQADAGIRARVRRILFLGGLIRYFVTCGDALREVVIESPRYQPSIREGQEVFISFHPDDAVCFNTEGRL